MTPAQDPIYLEAWHPNTEITAGISFYCSYDLAVTEDRKVPDPGITGWTVGNEIAIRVLNIDRSKRHWVFYPSNGVLFNYFPADLLEEE